MTIYKTKRILIFLSLDDKVASPMEDSSIGRAHIPGESVYVWLWL